MPLYDYGCHACKKEWENFRSIADRTNEACPDCEGDAVIIIKNRAKPVCYGYFSENLNAYITGPKQKKKVMKQKNLEEI